MKPVAMGKKYILISFCFIILCIFVFGCKRHNEQWQEFMPCYEIRDQDTNYSAKTMSFTKLGHGGVALPDSAVDWIMVRDNETGLIWEVKQDKDGYRNYDNPHDADNTYTWYEQNRKINGKDASGEESDCDTSDFLKALNDAAFGGFSDWRLPNYDEFLSILDSKISPPGPTINQMYFPNTHGGKYESLCCRYWTSTMIEKLNGYDPNFAWMIDFHNTSALEAPKSEGGHVRAVRCGNSGRLGGF